jgi:hypothetical protein
LYLLEGLNLRYKKPRRHKSSSQRITRIPANYINECWIKKNNMETRKQPIIREKFTKILQEEKFVIDQISSDEQTDEPVLIVSNDPEIHSLEQYKLFIGRFLATQ